MYTRDGNLSAAYVSHSHTSSTLVIAFHFRVLFLTGGTGFSSAMLGITGFETSANFIEEQEPGVYAKTLRNMIIGACIVGIRANIFMWLDCKLFFSSRATFPRRRAFLHFFTFDVDRYHDNICRIETIAIHKIQY